jgi:flavodoxin
MKILIACYSRTGNTGRLGEIIQSELEARGHEVVLELIQPIKELNRWYMALTMIFPRIGPGAIRSLFSPSYKAKWLKGYKQYEQDIHPIAQKDLSSYDMVLIGGPKWGCISFPIARYLKEVTGLEGKKVGIFYTFAGPPLEVFEIELMDVPMKLRLEAAGAKMVASLGLSSAFHEYAIAFAIFKRLSGKLFKKPLEAYTIDAEYGKMHLKNFLEDLGV